MILGIGVDICPVDRIAQILARHGATFADRVFTPGERERAGNGVVMAERLSARFAAKEAAIKALGGPLGVGWKEMEVITAADGSPTLHLTGKAAERARAMGVTRKLLSLSHAGGIAVAMVILEGDL